MSSTAWEAMRGYLQQGVTPQELDSLLVLTEREARLVRSLLDRGVAHESVAACLGWSTRTLHAYLQIERERGKR